MIDQQEDNSRGFSLLEMMTVISLIMILATFSMPVYRLVIVHGREAVLREDLFTLRSQIDRFTKESPGSGVRGPGSQEQWRVTGGEGQIQNLRFKRKAAIMPINHNEII